MNKILIIFDSDTSENESLGKISENILTNLKSEVRLRRVASIGMSDNTKEEHYHSDVKIVEKCDLIWADAYIFTFPIHTGTITASLKYFFDQYHDNISEGIFVNKLSTAMCVGEVIHAGAETAIQHLYSMLMQWGCIIIPTSIAFPRLMKLNGNPYGLSFVLDKKNSFGDKALVEESLTIHFRRYVETIVAFKNVSNSTKNKGNSYNIVDSLS